MDCPSLDGVAGTNGPVKDVNLLKKAVDTQLKRQGVSVGAFVVEAQGASFKSASREEVLSALRPKKGSTTYIVKDPRIGSDLRMMKAVKGEGMPTYKNPFVHGNLFLILTIEFPDRLAEDSQQALRKLLPPPLNVPTVSTEDADVEIHEVTEIDPMASHAENRANMQSDREAYDEDDESACKRVQCAQQ